MHLKKLKIVVIGGGTGSFSVLSGLKNLKNVDITAIVPSTDSGGSTGRLRDEFGLLPLGDIRQCLVALAKDGEIQEVLRSLFNYRFEKGGNGLNGHNFGNIFLTVLSDILGDELKAIKIVQKLLKIKGNIYPVTLQKCNLCAEYENGKIIEGEHNIDEPKYPHDGRMKIIRLFTDIPVSTYSEVKNKLINADIIIIGPGDLYTSIIANLIVRGVKESIQKSKAVLFYVVNLVTKYAQTYGFTSRMHTSEIEKYIQKPLDFVLINNQKLPENILKKYKLQNDEPVIDDFEENSEKIIRADLLASEEIKTNKGDVLKRSLIRHDSKKLIKTIMDVYYSKISKKTSLMQN